MTYQDDDAPPPRLTLRFLLHQGIERFFNVERGWLRTARELFTQPGAMIRRYIEADRKSYANPLSYLLMAMAISLVIQKVSGFQSLYIEQIRQQMVQSQQQLDIANRLTELIFQNLLYVNFAVYIPFALLLRFFFRRSGFNLAETFVFVFFAGGQMAFLGLLLVTLFLTVQISSAVYGTLGTLATLAYYSYAALGFYGARLGTVVKTCVAYLVAFGSMVLASMIATVIYILVAQPTFMTGEDWNLIRAAEDNLVPVARNLLEEGAGVDQTLQRTALHVASEKGHAEIVELLLEHGADVNARDHLGRVPMFLALNGRHAEIARQLAEAGTDATVRSHDDTTLLLLALRRDDPDMARWALGAGADVNAIRKESRQASALMAAAASGDLAMVELLLDRGADPSLTNEDGKTALDLTRDQAVKERLREAAR